MSKRFGRMLAFLCCLVMVVSLIPASFAAATDSSTTLTTLQANETPTAIFGTPELGSNDPLWALTMEHLINKSTVPDDPRPHATGTARILWDHDYLYARVVVKDSNLYRGAGGDYQYDSLEFYVGNGSGGSNQWRVSATGVLSGQSAPGRAAWTQITDTGYIVEMRIPKRTLTLQEGKLTFEIYINNSTDKGGDRYEVVSSFGVPDAGYSSDASFRDSLQLSSANEVDTRFSITATAGSGGTITPKPPGDVLRLAKGSSKQFTFTPDHGKIVDTVTVDGNAVTLSAGTYTFLNVEANHTILVTFKTDPDAKRLPFIVWNVNFARGEYTTAVIIDLGNGKAALGSALKPGLFIVSARNTTLNGDSVTFEGTRKITRVYANDKPKVRGYLGTVSHSPDYQDGLASGRYIVVEFEFYSERGGNITLDGNSNSTKQVYNIVQNDEIALTDGSSLSNVVFEQQQVVNPILDKFTTPTGDSVNRALYLHKDDNGKVVQGLPLYVYNHGRSRGGTNAETDPKAAMKSANGSVALMKKMEENPQKYASHILNISYNNVSTPSSADVKKVIDDLVASGAVDPNRIYVAGFSWGGLYTNSLVNDYPGFFAAAAPMSPVNGSPNASTNDAHTKLAYWMFINANNVGIYQTNLTTFINTNMPKMVNARASRFESNEALTWPYNQFDQPSQRPNPANTPALPDYVAHEVEAAVLYNQITMGTWSIAPTAQSSNLPAWNNDYTDVFDWMFAQSKADVPGTPGGFKATAGDGQVTLSWTAPWNGVSETVTYSVYKGTASGSYDLTPIATVSGATYNYTATGLTNGTTYYFAVKASNARGNSGYSNEVSATPGASNNANLSSMAVSGLTLSPSFDTRTFSYKASVANGVTLVTVTPTVSDSNATVKVNGTAVTSGQASGAISLNVDNNPISVAVTAQDGKTTQTYTVNVTRAEAITASSTAPIQVTTKPVSITVPASVTNAEIAVATSTAGSNKEATLPLVEVQAATTLGNVLTIPDGTKITAPANWDGTIKLPQVQSNSSVTVPGGNVSIVIEVGSTDVSLTFDRAVRLLLPNQGGKRVGFVRNGVFTEIMGTVTADTQAAADKIAPGGDAKITVGNDLVIWTKHFTKFASYTDSTNNTVTSGGGGGATNSATIAAASGGTVTLNGATIEVPAGAMATNSQVTIDKVSDASILAVDSDSQLVSEVYEIKKDKEGDFSKPVVITLPFDKTKVDFAKSTAGVYWLNEQTHKWVPLDSLKVDEVSGTASGSVSHFTKFAVLASDKAKIAHPQTNEADFADIKGHWSEANVRELVKLGAINGYADNTFKPNANITRAEFVTVIVKAFHLGAQEGKTFADTENHWAKSAIATAAAAGIVAGYNDNSFGPDDLITREQMAAIVIHAAKLAETDKSVNFPDSADISDWARTAIATATAKGLINGYGDGTVKPNVNTTRAEAVTVILRALKAKS